MDDKNQQNPSSSSLPLDLTLGDKLEKRLQSYYADCDPKYLLQGDIIRLDVLKSKLKELSQTDIQEKVYPYFFENHEFAIILNSDCDLVFDSANNRDGKVSCIAICPVTPLPKKLDLILKSIGGGDERKMGIISSPRTSEKFMDKFRKLVDNQEHPYFYLPEIPELGIHHVARVDNIISLQLSKKHLTIYKESRIKTLRPPFKSKLGEMASQLFHRVGLSDLKDELGVEDFKKFMGENLNELYIEVPEQFTYALKSQLSQYYQKHKKNISHFEDTVGGFLQSEYQKYESAKKQSDPVGLFLEQQLLPKIKQSSDLPEIIDAVKVFLKNEGYVPTPNPTPLTIFQRIKNLLKKYLRKLKSI